MERLFVFRGIRDSFRDGVCPVYIAREEFVNIGIGVEVDRVQGHPQLVRESFEDSPGIQKRFGIESFEIRYLVFVRLRLWPNGWSMRQGGKNR